MNFVFKLLTKQSQRYKGFLVLYLLLALVIAVASVTTSRLTGDLGQAAIDFDSSVLVRFIIIISVVTLLRAVASALSALLLGRFAGRAGYRFRDNFARYFLQKPFAAFEKANSGESLSVFSNDLPSAVNLVGDSDGTVSGSGLRMISDFISIIVIFVFMLTIHAPLTLILFASFPVLVAVQMVISIPIQKKQAQRLEARAKFNAIVNDSLQNTSTVASYSLEEIMVQRCDNAFAKIISETKNYAVAITPIVFAGMLTALVPILAVTAMAASRAINGYMTEAEFIAYVMLIFATADWLVMLSQRQGSVQTAAAGAKRLMETLDGETEDLSKGSKLGHGNGVAISAKNLSFSYPGADGDTPPTLDNVSFQIKKGSRVAFVGGSGSGKSTVLKLLLGLYQPTAGDISLMGTSTAELSLESQRSAFAYVPQDSFLFPESIGQNITGEEIPRDMPRLEKACRDAGILDFINSLPGRFDAELNESAENISGGQKQRIALARAFYRDASIILFDEATSALDPATEAAILTSFDSISQEKTVVMVAHRLKAINFCDTIIVMDGGKVAAVGTHDGLLDTCPIYKNLYDSQSKEAI